MAYAVRYQQSRLTVKQKAENIRIETERRNAQSSQAASVRLLLDKRHRYATRSTTIVDSVAANASTSNNVYLLLHNITYRSPIPIPKGPNNEIKSHE